MQMCNNQLNVLIQGGLGNMMFQSAFALCFSMKNNCNYNLVDFNQAVIKNSMIGRDSKNYADSIFFYFDKKQKINYFDKHFMCPFHFEDFKINPRKNYLLSGYFQSEKYFYDYDHQVKSYFIPKKEIFSKLSLKYNINFSEFTSLHIRRGDFLTQPKFHPTVNENYIHNAINFFGKKENFLVFSDDIAWCKEVLKKYNCFFVERENEVNSLYMMQKCQNNIISNSSFSWWGAWLNSNENKVVIRPNFWLGEYYNHLDTDDVYPKNWKIIYG